MHAIRQYEFGPAENLRYEEVDDPHPGAGQLRVAVEAAGAHFVDTTIRRGRSGGPLPPSVLPMTPGREVAGVVDELGTGVDESWLGTRVVAHLGPANGGYAELAVREVEAAHVVPDSMSFDMAVAMIGTGRTTLGILDIAQLRREDVLLVTAAAGGIGTLLVQAGRNVGATVVGVAGGADKVERVRASGAAVAVDYHDPEWPAVVRQALDGRAVIAVLEGVGGELGRRAFELLGPGGRLIMFGWASGFGKPTELTTMDLVARGLTATWVLGPALTSRHSVEELEANALEEAAAGRLVPAVQTFPLKDAAAAHTAMETRATIGKVVLLP